MSKQLDRDVLNNVLAGMLVVMTTPAFPKGVIEQMTEVLVKKGQDYSGSDHTWKNFEVAAQSVGINVDQVFLSLIGTKIARLVTLVGEGREPNFESTEDSWLDCANYIVLLIGYKRYLALMAQELPQVTAEPPYVQTSFDLSMGAD